MRGIQLHQAAFHHLLRLILPANAQELLSAGDGFHQQFQNLIQNRFICRIALFQNFQFQNFLEIVAVLFFFLQFSRISNLYAGLPSYLLILFSALSAFAVVG